jgi:hypothetical protein
MPRAYHNTSRDRYDDLMRIGLDRDRMAWFRDPDGLRFRLGIFAHSATALFRSFSD